MLVLRFKQPGTREFLVPLNVRVGRFEVPIGLGLVFLIVLLSAISNLFTKPVATVGGLVFTGAFLSIFLVTEAVHNRRRRGEHHVHLEQFNRALVDRVTSESLGLTKPFRKLVAIRSPNNLYMLDKALVENDPQTTDVVVMTAKVELPGGGTESLSEFDTYDQQLLTAVVTHAERLGKSVTPLVVPTNNALHAVLNVAKDLPAQELILGASNVFSAEEQLDQIAFYWINLYHGESHGLTVHIVSADRALTFDIHGGNRIPKFAERQSKTVADLRDAGIGIRRVLLVHDGTPRSHDVFEWMLTMIAPDVHLDLVPAALHDWASHNVHDPMQLDQRQAVQLGRSVQVLADEPQGGPDIVRLAREGNYDVLVLPWPDVAWTPAVAEVVDDWINYVRQYAPCNVLLAAHPVIPARGRGNMMPACCEVAVIPAKRAVSSNPRIAEVAPRPVTQLPRPPRRAGRRRQATFPAGFPPADHRKNSRPRRSCRRSDLAARWRACQSARRVAG